MSDAIEYALLKEISVLNAAQYPDTPNWNYFSDPSPFPSAPTDGADVSDSIYSLVSFRMRQDPSKYQGYYTINCASPGPQVGEKPGVRVNTNPYGISAGIVSQNVEQALTEIGALVDAGEGTTSTVSMQNDLAGTLSIASPDRNVMVITEAIGLDLVNITEDAWQEEEVLNFFGLYGLIKGTNVWVIVRDMMTMSIDTRNPVQEFSVMVRTSCYDRLMHVVTTTRNTIRGQWAATPIRLGDAA